MVSMFAMASPVSHEGAEGAFGLAASWEVHVTVETDKDGGYMWEMNPPRDKPVVTVAKGGVSLHFGFVLLTIR